MRHGTPDDRHIDMAETGSPSQSWSNWHPDDILLRSAGYRIAARPKVGPVLWWNVRGKLVEHAIALRCVRTKEVG